MGPTQPIRSSGRRTDDGGFTLIELMVVVLVIAVLLAFAIPTFLGARDRANDRAVGSNVRNAFTAARSYYTDKLEFTDDTAAMTAFEPSIIWTNTGLDGTQTANTIYIEAAADEQSVVIVGRSKGGRCYYLRDVMQGALDEAGTHYQAQVPSGAACSVPAPADPAWADTWPS